MNAYTPAGQGRVLLGDAALLFKALLEWRGRMDDMGMLTERFPYVDRYNEACNRHWTVVAGQ